MIMWFTEKWWSVLSRVFYTNETPNEFWEDEEDF